MSFDITEYDARAVKRAKLLYIVPVNIIAWPFLCIWHCYKERGGPKSLESLKAAWCEQPTHFKCADCRRVFHDSCRGKIYPSVCKSCEADEICT